MIWKILLLILACSIPCIAKPEVSIAVSTSVRIHSEFYPSRFLKNINEINPPAEVNSFGLFNYFVSYLRKSSVNRILVHRDKDCLSRIDGCSSLGRLMEASRERSGQRMDFDFNITRNLQLESGCVPKIFDANFYMSGGGSTVSVSNPSGVAFQVDTNISPQLAFRRVSCVREGVFCGSRTSYGGFNGFLSVSNGFSGSTPHQSSENPQADSSDEQASGEPSGPPIWRIPAALIFGIGANPIMVWGMIIHDRRRWRWLSWFLCICAALMFAGRLLLMYCLCVPGTWGWWF